MSSSNPDSSADRACLPLTQAGYRSFLRGFILSALPLLGLIITLNYRIDPYFLHQWDSPLLQRLSPAQPKLSPWLKTYAAYRYQPDIVFLGSSRTEIGLPVDLSFFPGKKVLNLSLSGGSIGDSLTMLRHTSFFHRPETIVWGLEYGPLFQNNNGNSDLTPDLIAHDQWYGLRRFWKHIQRTLALDMTIATMNILSGQSEQICLPIMATHGHKPSRCLVKIMADEGGTAKAFAAIMNEEEYPETPPPFAPVLEALDAAIGDYCQQGTQHRLFIQPLHALNELYWQKRSGKDMDEWKRALTAMTDKHQRQGCDIRLMDFGGINSVTAEETPQMSGRENMRYYWEHSHYSSEAGTMLLHRLFAPLQSAASPGFGVLLQPHTIERHLEQQRQARIAYCLRYPRETAKLQSKEK